MNTLYDPGRGWVEYESDAYGSIGVAVSSAIHSGELDPSTGVTAVEVPAPPSPSLNALNSSSEPPVILSLDEQNHSLNNDR